MPSRRSLNFPSVEWSKSLLKARQRLELIFWAQSDLLALALYPCPPIQNCGAADDQRQASFDLSD